MKTRVIQEPDEPATGATYVPRGPDRVPNEAWIRWIIVGVGVVGYFVLGVVHPADLHVGDETTLYLALHLLQPLLILCLAWGLWLLVRDLPGRAAQVARLAIVPFAIAYATLDAVAGIAEGVMVREANEMSPVEAAAIERIFAEGSGVTTAVTAGIWVASGLTWFIAAFAAALALKPIGGRGPTILMAVGAAIFAVGHPFPPGPIGIALFGLGFVWLELRRERAPAAEPSPEPVFVP
jgi:hypothetical protein